MYTFIFRLKLTTKKINNILELTAALTESISYVTLSFGAQNTLFGIFSAPLYLPSFYIVTPFNFAVINCDQLIYKLIDRSLVLTSF